MARMVFATYRQTRHAPVWRTWRPLFNLKLLIWSKWIHKFHQYTQVSMRKKVCFLIETEHPNMKCEIHVFFAPNDQREVQKPLPSFPYLAMLSVPSQVLSVGQIFVHCVIGSLWHYRVMKGIFLYIGIFFILSTAWPGNDNFRWFGNYPVKVKYVTPSSYIIIMHEGPIFNLKHKWLLLL